MKQTKLKSIKKKYKQFKIHFPFIVLSHYDFILISKNNVIFFGNPSLFVIFAMLMMPKRLGIMPATNVVLVPIQEDLKESGGG